MGAKLHRLLDHDDIQCSLSWAEFCKNILLNGMICVIFYLTACIILENTFKIQHFAASSQKEHGHNHAEQVNIPRPDLNCKTKLKDICACNETLLKSKVYKTEGKRLISKSIASCLINKEPQIPASSQMQYIYSSLTSSKHLKDGSSWLSLAQSGERQHEQNKRFLIRSALHSFKQTPDFWREQERQMRKVKKRQDTQEGNTSCSETPPHSCLL